VSTQSTPCEYSEYPCEHSEYPCEYAEYACEHAEHPMPLVRAAAAQSLPTQMPFPAEPSTPRSHSARVPHRCVRPSPSPHTGGSAERSTVTGPRPRRDTGGMSGSSLARQCCASSIVDQYGPRTTHRAHTVLRRCLRIHPCAGAWECFCVRMCALVWEGEGSAAERRAHRSERRTQHTGGSAEYPRVSPGPCGVGLRPHCVRACGRLARCVAAGGYSRPALRASAGSAA
jgi:hypothetical protein